MEPARIEMGAIWAVLRADADQMTCASDTLSFEAENAEHVRARRPGWDGIVRLMRPGDNRFPAGLAWRVRDALLKAGFPKPVWEWPPANPEPPLAPCLEGVELRDYQIAAVEKAVRARRICIQCPTGGGKTEIGMEWARRLGKPTLWLTHRRALADQTTERLRARLGKGAAMVQVAMVPTLYARIEDPALQATLRKFEVVVADEAHHAGAPSWQAVLKALDHAHHRLGLSATLDTLSDQVAGARVEGAFGPTFVIETTTALATRGYLASPVVAPLRPAQTSFLAYEEIRAEVCPGWRRNPRQLRTLGAKMFRLAYDRGIVTNDFRNAMIVERAVAHASAGEKFLVLVARVPHAAALVEAIRSRLPASARVWGLDGGAGAEERESVLGQFKGLCGAGAVLVATPFFREGMDVPQVDAGMLAGGGLSDVATLQALGRMLRPRPDKAEVLVYDFVDGGALTNRPEKDWLAVHSAARMTLYRTLGFKVVGGGE